MVAAIVYRAVNLDAGNTSAVWKFHYEFKWGAPREENDAKASMIFN